MKELLRLCSLSYSIVLLSISNNDKKNSDLTVAEDYIDYLIEKRLTNETELKRLGFCPHSRDKRFFTANGEAMKKWYLPIMWASHIVRQEQNKDGK